jgi:hypothetical protein
MVVPLEALRRHCEETGSNSRTSLAGETVSASSANAMHEGLN